MSHCERRAMHHEAQSSDCIMDQSHAAGTECRRSSQCSFSWGFFLRIISTEVKMGSDLQPLKKKKKKDPSLSSYAILPRGSMLLPGTSTDHICVGHQSSTHGTVGFLSCVMAGSFLQLEVNLRDTITETRPRPYTLCGLLSLSSG